MPYAIRLPDGTLIKDIPDEITPEQAKQRIMSAGMVSAPPPAPTFQPPPPPAPEGGFFPSVKRGFLQTGMLIGDVLPAMVGKAIGAEDYAKKQWEEAAETQKRIEREVPAAVPSYKDISSFGDAWVYAKEAVGESLASIIPSLLTGGAAGLLARPAVAAANTAAREAAEKTLMSAALSMGPPTQVALESAKKAAVQAGIDAAKRTVFRYEVAGGLAGSALQNIPEVYQNIKEETGKEDIPAALIAGGFNAALDTVLPVQLLKKIRGQGLSEKEVMAAWYKRGAKGLGKGFLTEGATEAAQEASSILAENFVAENSDVFNGKNLERVINAGLKGGLGGGVITAATDIATGKAPPPEQTDRQRIEQLQREILGDVQTARSEKALEEAENAKKAAEDAEAARKEAERAPTVPELITIAQGQNAYSALEAEKQRLLGQEKKTKEVKEAIEVIKELQGRLVIEDVTRRAPSVPAEMDDKTIRSLGFVKSENPESVYQQLLGKSTRDPDVTAFLKNYAETKAKPQTKDRINTFLGRVERAQIPLTAEEIAEGERRAREAVTEPSGASAPVVGEPGAGAPAAGVGVPQPSGVVPPVTPVGEPPVGERAAPAPVAPPPVTPPAAPPVEPPAPPPVAPPIAPPAELLISLPPRLQNITPAERDLYNFNQSLVEAQTPIIGFDFERISDAPSPDGRGMTPESLVLSLEGTLGAVKDLDGKLRSKNRTGATVSQLIDQWKTASQIQARINQSKQDNPELWSNYATRQKELGGLKVGDLIQIETGEIGKLDAKFPKNWRIVFDESTPGILAGTKLLRPKEALRPAPAPTPVKPAETPATPTYRIVKAEGETAPGKSTTVWNVVDAKDGYIFDTFDRRKDAQDWVNKAKAAPPVAEAPAPEPAPAAAPTPAAEPAAAPTIITAEQLINLGVKKTQPMIRRIAGKNMDVPADRANVLTELNKYINNKDNSPESRENLAKFRDRFEEVGKTVTVAPTKAKKPWKTVMGSQLLALVDRTGGLDPSLMQEFSTKFITKRLSKSGKQLVQFRNPPTQNGQLFRAGGMSDYVEIAELLEGAGYLEPGAVEADYKEAGERAKTLISTALNRGQVLTFEQQEQEARLRQEDIDKQEQAKQEQLKVEREAEALAERQAIIEAEGLTPADLDTLEDNIPFLTEAVEKTPERLAADMRDMGFTEEEIADAVAEFSRKAVAVPAPEARAEEAPQAPATPEAAEELELEAPTAEELAAREKREADAREAEREEQKRLEQKRKADAERGEFVLTGSDRPADVAEAAGQMSIFGKPSLPEAAPPKPVKLSKETQAKIDELSKLMQKMLGKMGLKNVALNLAQDLERNGEYANRLITLALDATNPVRDLRHESLHAMKELGFFSDAQWATLTKMARDKWIDKYLKSRQSVYNGQAMSRYDAYIRLYGGDPSRDFAGQSEATRQAIYEEAIADAFGDFDATKAPPGFLQTMLFRMREFFRNIREAMGAANIDSAEDIFRRVERGELKETAPAVEAPARASLRAPQTEAFKRWFGDSKIVDAEGKPLALYRGVHGFDSIPEEALNAKAREGYATFASNNPAISNTYANPNWGRFGDRRETGALVPVYVKANRVIEFPTRTNSEGWRTFDKFDFDRRAKTLRRGEVLVVRGVTDTGPRSNLEVDPGRGWSYPSDIYAWGPGTSVKSATGNIGTYDVTKPDIRYSLREVPLSTRGLMEVQPIVAMQELGLKTDAVRKPGGIELFNDVRSIALALNQETIRNHGQIAKTDTSLTSEKELARAMVDEIGYQLRATADTGTGWYSDNYPKAVKKLGKLFPELETNPYARTVFSALVAITSNGEKVSLNVKNAIKLYEDIRMGKDPRDIGSRRKNALDNNVAVVMQLMQQYGPAGMRNELLREITVKDMNAILRARGEKPDTSYLADAKVPAAALYFGPKLGAFFSNLEGAEGYLTMDMWWTRTVNRMRGQLESRATEASIKKFAEMMDKPNATRDEVVAATIPLRNKYEEFGWHTELEELVGSKEPAEDKNKPAWTAKAKRKAGSAYQGLLFEHRLEKMANTIYKNEYEMLQELPFTAKDREFMYRTARRAQSLLKSEGINLSLADIQAALWYYEKRLYQHLSGRKADDIGYDEAITQLARESTGPARPSVVFAGQPVPGAGPTGTGAAAIGVGGKPAKPSLRDVEGMPTIGPKMDGTFLRRMENIRQQIGDAYISGEIDSEEFHKRYAATNEEYVNALFVQKKIDEAKPAAGLEEVFPGFVFIPEGTKVLATSGLSYPEPTEATVVGAQDIRIGAKAYKLPVVDFGDGRQRRLAYGDVKEVFAPRPVKPSLRDVPRANLRDQLNITTLQRIEQTTVAREEKGFVQRITEAISPKNFGFFRQQALNRYEGLSRADRMKIEQMGGVDLLADAGAESAALLSDMGAGVTASALGVHDRKGGAPVYNHYFVVEVNNRALAKRYTSKAQAQAAASAVNGVVRERGYVTVSNFNDSVKGPVLIFAPLMEKYKDPMIFQAFQFYSAAKRGARFMYTLDAKGNVIEKLFTADDINIELPRLEAQFPEFKTVHAEWIKYNDKLVDYMRDTGVISEQNAQTFKMHGDYFPFYRQIDGQDDALGPRIFQSISAVKPPKKLKGSELALGDFLENIVRNTQSAVQAGVKNVAARRAAQVGMDVGIVSEIAPGITPESANSFYVLENGLKKFYETTDHLFIDSIKSLNLPDMPFIGMLAGPANLLRNLVTKDPGFILANLMRDSMSAWATSGVKMTPIVDTMRNFAGALVNQNPEYKALLNAGVIGGYEFSQNIQTSGKEFGAAIRKTAGVPTFGEKIAKPFTSVWETLEKATTASDAATRMEIYKRTLAETGNEAEAIFRALEVMNFNRKGSSAVIRILTAAVPFLNARMQGLDILYRAAIAPTVRGDTSERARQIQKTFFVRGAYLMALSAMYWLLTHDDEDYKKQEQETRDNYWLLPSLGIKIPIPFEVGVLFKVIPERILAYTLGTDTGKDFADSMKRQLISTLAFNPIPQTVLPLVETVTNFSFFTWRPIIPQGLENVAPEYQVGPGTSKLAEGIGKTLKLSPMKIDQIINGYTGTMGMYAVDLMDSIYNTMADSPKPSKRFEQMPVIRRFAVDPEARGTVTAYYDLKNAVDQVVRTENLLERTMDYENWGPYMQENMKLLASKDYVSDMEKTLKELREMKTLIRASTMSADAKRDSITQIGQMENALTANIQQLKKMFRE